MENKEIKGYKEASELCEKVLKSRNKYNLYKEGLRPIANLKHMLETSVELFPDNVAFWQKFKKGEPYTPITFRQTLEDVNALGTALISRGLKNKKIGVIGENSYFWAISYLAVACGVGVVVPLDKELSAGELEQLVEQSGISCVLMSSKYKLTFKSMLDRKVGNLEFLVDTGAESSNDRVYAYRELIAEGKNLLSLGDRAYLDAEIDPEALGVLLFTSGTTGVSKGVMLSHRNLCSEIMLAPLLIKYTQDDIFFSVLPLHHTYECTCGFLVSIYRGSSIGYCEGLKYIQKNLQELKPTIFCGVPLIFDNLHNAIMKNVRKQGKEALVTRIMKVGRFTERFGIGLPKALLGKIRDVFGGRMRLLVSGGAAIRPEIMRFFNDLGFIMIQGYGLTECAPLAAAIPTEKKYYNYDSVGRVMEQVEVKIIDKDEEGVGEICLKGPNVMMGYYNNPEETEKSLIDGWFHTGDLGYIDKQKYIYITGRKKNVIITANGKNVYPEELENYLDESLFVSESMVWSGDDGNGNEKTIIATIKPDMDEVRNYLGDEADDPESIRELIQSEVDRINEPQPLFKKIGKVIIKMDDFDKTTTKKIKRFNESNKGE
ncbi:MAG: AMP-binding protein [Firmicutes bacterium]|nr:AMP-binding protein [Bacillota bacterium]MBR6955832.1 AMP-binding protein [Bacillota bacterium]